MRRSVPVLLAVFSLAVSLIGLAPDAGAAKPVRDPIDQPVGSPPPTKQAEAIGRGGAVSSVDAVRDRRSASSAPPGRQCRRCRDRDRGRARRHRALFGRYRRRRLPGLLRRPDGQVSTIDGRETAPASFTPDVFTDARRQAARLRQCRQFGPVGRCPRHPGACGRAARNGSARWSLNRLLRPAEKLARDGFVVDSTFNAQTAANAARFANFPETERVYLPGGKAPAVGSRRSATPIWPGPIGSCAATASSRCIEAGWAPPWCTPPSNRPPGPASRLRRPDHQGRPARLPEPGRGSPTRPATAAWTSTACPCPSSGGIAVGEALNLLEAYDRRPVRPCRRRPTAIPAPVRPRPPPPRSPTATAGSVTCPVFRHASFSPSGSRTNAPASCSTRRRPTPGRSRSADPDGAYDAARRPTSAQPLPSRRPRHHPPGRHRPLGQRRVVHLDHRADRRLRHHRARLRLPAQQRTHRLQLRAGHTGRPRPQPSRRRENGPGHR